MKSTTNDSDGECADVRGDAWSTGDLLRCGAKNLPKFPAPHLVVEGRPNWTGRQISGHTDNSTQTGAMRELRVAADLMERGHQVFRNMAPSGIDLVAYIRGDFIRVEVATTGRLADGTIMVPNKGPRCEFDLLAAVLPDGTIAYYGMVP